jgi:hypothetical protein
MEPPMSGVTAHAQADRIESAATGHGAGKAFAVASRRVRRLLAVDAAAWFATDPVTSLPSEPRLLVIDVVRRFDTAAPT